MRTLPFPVERSEVERPAPCRRLVELEVGVCAVTRRAAVSPLEGVFAATHRTAASPEQEQWGSVAEEAEEEEAEEGEAEEGEAEGVAMAAAAAKTTI